MPMRSEGRYDAIVVGAGFGGVQVLHELKKLGLSACGLGSGPIKSLA